MSVLPPQLHVDFSDGFLTLRIRFKLLTKTWKFYVACACCDSDVIHHCLLTHFRLHWPAALPSTHQSHSCLTLCPCHRYCQKHSHLCFYMDEPLTTQIALKCHFLRETFLNHPNITLSLLSRANSLFTPHRHHFSFGLSTIWNSFLLLLFLPYYLSPFPLWASTGLYCSPVILRTQNSVHDIVNPC